MQRRSTWLALLCLAIAAMLLIAATPAQAIIGGTQDAANIYKNVGMNLEFGAFVPGQWGWSASCTLVKNEPGNVIVLLAAHQLAWNPDPKMDKVTFEPVPDFGWEWTDATGIGLGDVKTYDVVDYAIHPDYSSAPLSPCKLNWIGPGREDVALMWLDEQVYLPDGSLMPTSPIIGLHGLDALARRGETFTAVGYGTTGWLLGSDISLFAGGAAAAAWDGRNYKAVSVLTEHGAFLDRYLKMSTGEADGDSGGPLLHDGVILTVCSLSSPRQDSPAYDYRLDTYSAQKFLSDYGLVPVPPAE